MDQSIREIISSTVESLASAVTEAVNQGQDEGRPSSSRNPQRSQNDRFGSRKRKPPSYPLPSSFLKKNKGKQKKVALKTWNKDIICLPKHYHSNTQKIPIPRGAKRGEIAMAGLIGKISLTSNMSEEEIREEICAIFTVAFGGDDKFPFRFLQTVGGGTRYLNVPCQTSNLEWTAQDLVSSAGKGAIYILAEKETIPPDDSEKSDEGCWRDAVTDPEHADCIYLAPEPEPPCYVEDDNQPTSSSASRYEEFVNLLDCPSPEDSEIEELFNLPIIVNSDVTENNEKIDVGDVLHSHKQTIIDQNEENARRITVRRNHLLGDTLKMLKIRPWNPANPLKVTFLGEPGIDDGGPRREYVRLMMSEIGRNNSLFQGPLRARVPSHNTLAVKDRTYFYIGQILALSLLNDGPGIQCLVPTTAQYLLGNDSHIPSWEEIPDISVQVKLRKISKATRVQELQDLLASDEYDFLNDCGISVIPSKVALVDKSAIVEAAVKHFCIFACKAELDEILLGLDSFQLTTVIRRHPKAFLPLFTFLQPAAKTASSLEAIFTPKFSPQGSNRRVLEEEATFFWISILAEIEGHASDLEFSFEDILIFVTGATDVPPMGFSPSPTIEFCDEIKYPIASTCSNVLTLPLNQAYEEFKDNFVFGILNSHGFMRL